MKAEVRRNTQQNGIEIRFPGGNPGSDILSWLHAHRYRWARGRRNWYKTYSQSEFEAAQQKFEDSSDNTPATPAPAPVIKPQPVEMTAPADQAAILNAGGWPLNDLYGWAKMSLAQFMGAAPKIVRFPDNKYLPQVELNTKKNQYEFLPPKRKRPDTYIFNAVHEKVQEYCLKRGLVIPLSAIYCPGSVSLMYFTAENLSRHIKDYPQQKFAPDYDTFLARAEEKHQQTHADAIYWQGIRDKYFQVGQSVWRTDNKGVTERWKVSSLRPSFYDRDGYAQDVIPLTQNGGWISYMGDFRITSLYLEDPGENPLAKTFTPPQEPQGTTQAQDAEKARAKAKAKARLFLLSAQF